MTADRALVALSGGVDSSYAMHLCLDRFRYVRAGYVRTSDDMLPPEVERTARAAGVELVVIDASDRFRRDVILWSESMLSDGLTPNPCARCNARVKLLALFELLEPSEVLVTGHYVRKSGELLLRGLDSVKDQSYFLSLVPGGVLDRCTFPLGDMYKSDVRTEALRAGIPFRREESMDLCFDMSGGRSMPGKIVDMAGIEIGTHEGIGHFTVGQRKGFGAFGRRMYVVSIDPMTGKVTIGNREDLFSTGCTLTGMNWLRKPSAYPIEADVQTRYRRKAFKAVIDNYEDELHVAFTSPEWAVAPGQVCSVYLDASVIGGGIISSTLKPDWKRNEE
jgi:tRNA-uridine 2-sulfurtransferase